MAETWPRADHAPGGLEQSPFCSNLIRAIGESKVWLPGYFDGKGGFIHTGRTYRSQSDPAVLTIGDLHTQVDRRTLPSF
jgi:hypothetical protein